MPPKPPRGRIGGVFPLVLLACCCVSLSRAGVTVDEPPQATAAPYYTDPLFDAAHDAEFVWHEDEQCWWMTYLQNRFNSPLVDIDTSPWNCTLYCGTDFGLASTPDHGKTWIYRGVMRGLAESFGASTWWRPAVTRTQGLYHGYFVHRPFNQDTPCGEQCIVHHTSFNLKDWKVVGILMYDGAPVFGYDSVVRQIQDGRWILMSTMIPPDPTHTAYESDDLYNWRPCTTPSINEVMRYLNEGPHITEWKGKFWLNFDGQDQRLPNVARSDDGGLSWKLQPKNMYTDFSNRPFDGWCGENGNCDTVDAVRGAAHQGPILAQGDRAYALYLVEFSMSTKAEDLGKLHNARSMLQIAEVTLDEATGTLSVNRSAETSVELKPPADAKSGPTNARHHSRTGVADPAPPVWSIAAPEARTVALAEFNRWYPGWAGGARGWPQEWRDAALNERYFTSEGCVSSGSAVDTVWTCIVDTRVLPSQKRARMTVKMDARGTVQALGDSASGETVPRQYRRDPPLQWSWVG